MRLNKSMGNQLKPEFDRSFWQLILTGCSAFFILNAAGCSNQRTPMQVSVTQLAPYVNAAKDPTCTIPVLSSMPVGTYTQVAIVEAWADVKDTKDDVLPALRRKACETGADALVILNSTHQDVKQLLYQASPNEQLNDTTQQNVYAGQGEYIQEMEHTRRIGEAGHNGLYIDAIAITYDKADKGSANGSASALPQHENDSAHPQS
ncbi:MAG TPA: hypothetical protein VJ728_10115 [Candidatus Binataceae bacterium]|nr:hypothetical protein [Candidatus Binataceae bacterium]